MFCLFVCWRKRKLISGCCITLLHLFVKWKKCKKRTLNWLVCFVEKGVYSEGGNNEGCFIIRGGYYIFFFFAFCLYNIFFATSSTLFQNHKLFINVFFFYFIVVSIIFPKDFLLFVYFLFTYIYDDLLLVLHHGKLYKLLQLI